MAVVVAMLRVAMVVAVAAAVAMLVVAVAVVAEMGWRCCAAGV